MISEIFDQQFQATGLAQPRKAAGFIAFGVYDKGQLVGGLIARHRYDHLKITELAVKPAYQGQRLGTQLIQTAEAFGRQHHVVTITLGTRSYQAADFYRKCGYQVYGEIVDLPMRGVTTYYFVKRL